MEEIRHDVLGKGIAVGDRIASGRVNILYSLDKRIDGHEFRPGDVLVTDMTDPDWEPIMKMAAAIITNKGGRTCHAAIVAREMGVPAIVGCGDATEWLKDGLLVTAAVATAAPIVHMRKHRWRGSPGDLAPWQCAIAAAALLPLAWGMEGPPAVAWSPRLALLLAYATLPCTAFAFWALTWISKELPAMTTSLGLLGVPLVGVASASLELGEPLTSTLLGALALIAAGVAVGTLGGRAKRAL